jgi:hypothetical protein
MAKKPIVQKAEILDPWVIEDIRRREEEKRRREEDRPVVQIDDGDLGYRGPEPGGEKPEKDRGVTIINYFGKEGK